jgi:hypothetical protein
MQDRAVDVSATERLRASGRTRPRQLTLLFIAIRQALENRATTDQTNSREERQLRESDRDDPGHPNKLNGEKQCHPEEYAHGQSKPGEKTTEESHRGSCPVTGAELSP